MLDDSDAISLLKNVSECLKAEAPELHKQIDSTSSERLARSKPMTGNVRIRFKAGTVADTLFAVQKAIAELNDAEARRTAFFTGLKAGTIRLRVRVESPDERVPHNQAIGRFFGAWGRRFPRIFLKGTTGFAKSPSTMFSDPVEGKRSQLGEFTAAGFGGTGQWKIFPDAWATFAGRHGLTESAEDIEALVADSRTRQ